MKSSKLFLSLAAAIIFLASAALPLAAQNRSPQTVLDYYMLLTPDHLPALESAKNRRSIIKTQDTANGYLRLEGGWEGWAEVALFRRKNREAVIGVVYVGCGPACGGAAQFLTYRNGEWTDATADVMPEIGDEDILAAYNRIKTADDDSHTLEDMPYTYWAMPRKGTTVALHVGDASASSDRVLMKFAWNGERFAKSAR